MQEVANDASRDRKTFLLTGLEFPLVLQPNFLNYAALLEARGGSVTIRVGGNTQDNATLVQSNPTNKTIEKEAGTDASLVGAPSIRGAKYHLTRNSARQKRP